MQESVVRGGDQASVQGLPVSTSGFVLSCRFRGEEQSGTQATAPAKFQRVHAICDHDRTPDSYFLAALQNALDR